MPNFDEENVVRFRSGVSCYPVGDLSLIQEGRLWDPKIQAFANCEPFIDLRRGHYDVVITNRDTRVLVEQIWMPLHQLFEILKFSALGAKGMRCHPRYCGKFILVLTIISRNQILSS